MKKAQKQKLRVDKILQLERIFEDKGWTKISDTDNHEFDNFCTMLTCFDETQQDLILNLTKDFMQIHPNDYLRHFYKAYKEMLSKIGKRYNKIIIQPLLAPADFKKEKSSKALLYFVHSAEGALVREAGDIEIKIIDTPEALSKESRKSTTLLCLIDDYLGTGNTAKNAINYWIEKKFSPENICVISLVAQHAACKRLRKIKIPVYCSKLRHKALSDNAKYSSDDIDVMRRIEKQMGVAKIYRFGYGRSEGLIRLIRIPNNTFPVYWYSRSQTVPTVPFPREG